ncbi:NAD(P)/FAD-dependent oxidoreductase [Acidiferrobacter sp.]|uniref:NAD(P)/FAD-dependent oxidoreductase n=1 Tax=Acidiferrobacter sp. TaxID=1872107 RepID=UPI0034353229
MNASAFDVLVVGLGPGGASAAASAAHAGLSVLAIDKRRTIGEPVQCAEFVPLTMGRYAKPALVQRIAGMRSVLPSGTCEHSDFPGLMVDRAAFDQALATEASRAGALLRIQTALKGLEHDQRVAILQGPEGRIERAHYKVLIAADGPHSMVARALGLSPLKTVETRQYQVPLRRPYEDTDIWLSDEFPGGYGWLFPRGPVANLGLGADRRLAPDLKAPLERLHAALARDEIVGAEVLGRTGGSIPVGGLRVPLVCDHILFVGDAAGLTHPITGAGIASAVVSGERAGLAAAGFLAGGATLDEYAEDMQDEFAESLARAVARREWLMERWHTPAARLDETHKRGWIAFREYFVR